MYRFSSYCSLQDNITKLGWWFTSPWGAAVIRELIIHLPVVERFHAAVGIGLSFLHPATPTEHQGTQRGKGLGFFFPFFFPNWPGKILICVWLNSLTMNSGFMNVEKSHWTFTYLPELMLPLSVLKETKQNKTYFAVDVANIPWSNLVCSSHFE